MNLIQGRISIISRVSINEYDKASGDGKSEKKERLKT